MAQLTLYALLWLLLSYVGFSNAGNPYGISAYAPPSVLLNNKYLVQVDQEIPAGFRLFDASSLSTDSKTIKYHNLQFATKAPNILTPKVLANKDKLIFYGIDGDDSIFGSTVMYSFDLKKKSWTKLNDVNMPIIAGYKQEEPFFVGPDSDGYAYLLYNGVDTMLIFNIKSLEWSEQIIQPFVPNGMSYYSWYTATLLPDGRIVYIGGRFANDTTTSLIDVPMNQVYVYDTKTGVWSTEPTGGTIPGTRNGHSASLASDGRIIVYGGMDAKNNIASPDLVVLDTTTFTWSWPEVTNPIGAITITPSVMVDNFMILYDGTNITSTRTYRYFNKVFMLDTTTYTWYALDPVAADEKENIYSQGSGLAGNNDTMLIFMAALVAISSLHVLLVLGAAFYKWYQKRYAKKNKVMVTP